MFMRLSAATVGLAAALSGCASGTELGTAAPSFTATDLDGGTVSLAAARGEVMILDFFAVW